MVAVENASLQDIYMVIINMQNQMNDMMKLIYSNKEELKKDNIQTERDATNAHFEVGKNIREVIAKNGGTMPEKLPTPKKSLKQLEKENKKFLKNTNC